MKRLVLVVALALSLAGCGLLNGPVPLRIYEGSVDGCSIAGSYELDLISDPTYGTVAGANIETIGMLPQIGGGPIWWPEGYTGRRDGFEVVVYNAGGKAVARTGARYVLAVPFDVSAAGRRLVACYVERCGETCFADDPSSGRAVEALVALTE